MAKQDKALHEQDGLERHREITNTGGQLDDDRGERRNAPGADEAEGLSTDKVGDDAWHHRANRRSEKGDDPVPMQGGNTAR
jgi:hypothetical protein